VDGVSHAEDAENADQPRGKQNQCDLQKHLASTPQRAAEDDCSAAAKTACEITWGLRAGVTLSESTAAPIR
jgi:hypothetical protein